MGAERKVEALWVDRARGALLCSITEKHFDTFLRPKLPVGAERRDKRALRFWAPDVVAVWLSSKVAKLEQQVRDAAQAEGDALMMGGDGKSPNLEKYRGIKAKLADLDLKVRQGELVDLRELEPALMGMAEVLRRHGATLARKFGEEAQALLAEAIDEWLRGVERQLAKRKEERDQNGQGDSPAAGPMPAA